MVKGGIDREIEIAQVIISQKYSHNMYEKISYCI